MIADINDFVIIEHHVCRSIKWVGAGKVIKSDKNTVTVDCLINDELCQVQFYSNTGTEVNAGSLTYFRILLYRSEIPLYKDLLNNYIMKTEPE